jgi:prepilin-type N-terminal cleavage/methylation domain-containing protein
MPTRNRKEGFTLVELLVVVLIIGILAGLSIPMYTKTLESSKAEDASGLVRMIGSTNRMFALDHNGTYANGALTDACTTDCAAAGTTGCALIACKYLAAEAWTPKPYRYWAGAGNCGAGTACGSRRQGSPPGTNSSPYKDWGYYMTQNGVVTPIGGAPAPPP